MIFGNVWHEGLIYKLKNHGIVGDFLQLPKGFLSTRKQSVVLNGQCSDWQGIIAGVPQISISGPPLFLIYINYLAEGLKSSVKLFADDTSIFFIVKDPTKFSNVLNSDLKIINSRAFQWKMSFNPDSLRKATDVRFAEKSHVIDYPDFVFNNNIVHKASSQKHLGLIPDDNLNFKEHIVKKLCKAKKNIGILRKYCW